MNKGLLGSARITWINFSNEYIKEKCKGIINTDSPLFQLYLQANNNDWKEAIKQYRKKKYEQKHINIVYKTK